MKNLTPYLGIIAFVLLAGAIIGAPFIGSMFDLETVSDDSDSEQIVLNDAERSLGVDAVLELERMVRRKALAVPNLLVVSSDERLIAGRSDLGLHLWNARDGRRIGPSGRRFLAVSSGLIESLAFSPDNRSLAAFKQPNKLDAIITLWDIESGDRRKVLEVEPNASFLSFSPDSTRIVWLGESALGVWGPDVGHSKIPLRRAVLGLAWFVGSDGDEAIVTVGNRLIDYHDPISLALTGSAQLDTDLHFIGIVGAGTHAIYSYADEVELRDLRSGDLVSASDGFTPDISIACAPPDMSWIALGGYGGDSDGALEGSIQIWRPGVGGRVASAAVYTQRIDAMACGSSKLIVTAADNIARVWNVDNIESRWALKR